MLELNYTLSEEDYVDFHYYTSWAAPRLKKARRRFYVNIAIFAALLIAISASLIDRYTDTGAFIAVMCLGIIILSVSKKQKQATAKAIRQMLSNEENADFLRNATLTFSETGIVAKNEVTETRFQWKAIVRRSENERSYFLYQSTLQAIVIPKRALKSPEQKAAFEKILNQHIPLHAEFETE